MTPEVLVTAQLIFSATETIRAGERVLFYPMGDGTGTIIGKGVFITRVSRHRLRVPTPPMILAKDASWLDKP